MRRLPLLFLACSFSCISASAADRAFHEIVEAIAGELHARPTHIPLFGLVNAFTSVARPAGTKHIDLAVFEDLDSRRRAGRDLPTVIREAAGGSWKPFVQVSSKRQGREETVLIFLRQEGRDCHLLITSIERKEAAVVQLLLNQAALESWMSAPQVAAHRAWK